MLFTPGDVVYSSSAILESEPPNLAVAKLHSLMEARRSPSTKLREALAASAGVKVHVVGDTIVDSYTYCSLIGGQHQDADAQREVRAARRLRGRRGIVAKHLRKAGAEVPFSTVLGDDALKDLVLADLEANGVACSAIVDPTRPTTQKNVFIADGYRLLKVDRLDNRPISTKILKEFADAIEATPADVVVFSDFRHGIFNPGTIPTLLASLPAGALCVSPTARWRAGGETSSTSRAST